MALDYRILQTQNPVPVFDPVAERQKQAQSQEAQLRLRDLMQTQQRQEALRPALAAYLQGDRSQFGAIAQNDPAQALKLQEDQRKRASELLKMYKGVQSFDDLQSRKALALRMGYTPDELDDFDHITPETFNPAEFRQIDAMLGEEAEGFTLSPGSVRYGADGRVIASVPHAPRTITVGEGQTVLELPGGGVPAPQQPRPGVTLASLIPGMIPGARVTSADRSPADNQRVGGVANSFHLQPGQAADFVPPQGMTMAQAAQMLHQTGQFQEVINEGDHVHVGGFRQQPQGPRVVAQGAPRTREGFRLLSADEAQRLQLGPGRYQQNTKTGQITQVSGTAPKAEKPPTEAQTNAAMFTFAALGGNERMNELAKDGVFKPTANLLISEANGVTKLVMSTEQDRLFVQAAKEFLAPILRKDTGAAVTDQEFVFYQDIYIPRPEDPPSVLWRKAQARDNAIRRLYGAGRKAFDAEYGPAPKWQVLTDPTGNPKNKRKGGGSGWGKATVVGGQ